MVMEYLLSVSSNQMFLQQNFFFLELDFEHLSCQICFLNNCSFFVHILVV